MRQNNCTELLGSFVPFAIHAGQSDREDGHVLADVSALRGFPVTVEEEHKKSGTFRPIIIDGILLPVLRLKVALADASLALRCSWSDGKLTDTLDLFLSCFRDPNDQPKIWIILKSWTELFFSTQLTLVKNNNLKSYHTYLTIKILISTRCSHAYMYSTSQQTK